MNLSALSFGLDIFILFLLAFTIYYALKLSRSLNKFRMNKAEFQALIQDLTMNIDKAHSAIHALKTATGDGNTPEALDDARALIDELKIITQSGQNLAARLEQNITNTKHATPKPHRSVFSDPLADDDFNDEPDGHHGALKFLDTLDRMDKNPSKISSRSTEPFPDPPSFFIQDRDQDDNDDPPLGSQAERELFEALRGKRKR